MELGSYKVDLRHHVVMEILMFFCVKARLKRVFCYEDLNVTKLDLYTVSRIYFDECASVCSDDVTCRAFVADNRQGTCALFRDKSTSSSNIDDVTRQKYFLKYEIQGVCLTTPELECYRLVGGTGVYTGRRMTTVSGITCQRFDQQTPHGHIRTNPASFFVTSLSEVENFCRDPDWNGVPWCYTVDPSVRFLSCGIPRCI